MKMALLELLTRIAVVVIIGIILPEIRRLLAVQTQNAKYKQIQEWALQAVKAAEQIHNKAKKNDPTGEIRREYARKAILRICYRLGVALTDEDIRALIEAAVNEVNNSGAYVIECGEVKEDES